MKIVRNILLVILVILVLAVVGGVIVFNKWTRGPLPQTNGQIVIKSQNTTVGAQAVSISGLTILHFWLGLALLGVGWNFAFVGATALVTQCHRPNERNKVQAVNDFLVFGSMALGSFSSGALLARYGWNMVAEVVLPVVLVAGVLLVGVNLMARPKAA